MILLTGGSGLLGTELQKHLDCYAPSHSEFDVLKPPPLPEGISMIVHAAAYTNVEKAEIELNKCYDINVNGTLNMIRYGLPIVYISTEYVFFGKKGNYGENSVCWPINAYAATKRLGEHIVGTTKKSLVIRCVFKPRPFKHPKACTDMWTSGDYVDVIAPMIAKAVKMFESWPDGNHILHIGTGRKSIYELAKQSNPNVEPCLRSDISVKLPKDTSLNCSKWENLIGQD